MAKMKIEDDVRNKVLGLARLAGSDALIFKDLDRYL